MSETLTDPQDGATPAEPAATEDPKPIAPGTEGAATDQTTEQPKPDRAERRIAALSARLAATGTDRDRLAAENAELRRAANPPAAEEPPKPEDIPRLVEERVARELAEREIKAKVSTFHETGQKEYPDWKDRCSSLIEMGVDGPLSEVLLELPAAVTASLADDPEELERIVGMKTERARAIALGKYAATLEAKPAPTAEETERVRVAAHTRRVSQAPAPIRPIGGNARVELNESTMSAQQLVENYSKQAMKARGL
jgi:hypothetical protein